ncbi:MAG: HDIG domain-containing protein [Spirochaetaceae bacterium]|jgi:putative nucleotidyltransferase with HDIG domain|nr:HDIG domain-containing protein [Spirochaetaceae bacterium]
MKENTDWFSKWTENWPYMRSFRVKKIRMNVLLASLIAFLLCGIILLGIKHNSSAENIDIDEYAVGKVSEQDVIADRDIAYIDQEASRLLRNEALLQVPAVFIFDEAVENDVLTAYSTDDPARAALKFLLDGGVFAMPFTGLENYNKNILEARHEKDSTVEREELLYTEIITMDTVEDAARLFFKNNNYSEQEPEIYETIRKNVRENVFFSPEASRELANERIKEVKPVMIQLNKGDIIVRKGFVINSENMEALNSLSAQTDRYNPSRLIARIIALLLCYGLIVFLLGEKSLGRLLKNSEVYLLCALTLVYVIVASSASSIVFPNGITSGILIPAALVVILSEILVGPRVAIILAFILPLVSFCGGVVDLYSYVFILVSGLAATFVIRGSERRMDLVIAGIFLAVANCIAMVCILLLQQSPAGVWPASLFWSAFNGIAQGMLVLGILPPLERAMNAPTTFRLIELSDLNSPFMKRFFNAAPGTYSHSLMVANLAEQAAQEIGANPLLARVGAYYHDIGKIDKPDYFVENQTDHNKHDDINPRLSVTVIKSHVKLGLEKGRQLRLPEEVLDVIGEHHGNSVITWFYNEALKRDASISPEEFSYSGNIPRSKESAIVMLADTTEAAVRTLKKTTFTSLEKYIHELIMGKVEHGLLADSELTFRDLTIIQDAFVRVLAGYYHSRIEYPKEPMPEGAET